MAAPATNGQQRSSVESMELGDYIMVNWTATATYQIGDGGKPECPVTGVALNTGGSGGHLNYYFYMVKVDRGLLIGDRVWYHTVAWDTLNNAKQIEGAISTVGTVSGIIRSLTGGVAYADASGNRSLVDLSLGSWPTMNEWEKYLVNFPESLIQSGKTKDSVWNYTSAFTLCQDTPLMGLTRKIDSYVVNTSNVRVVRGTEGATVNMLWMLANASNAVSASIGFRPVFEYKEV